MIFPKLLFFVFGFPVLSHGVKVNVQGSLSLGKQVLDTISQYLKSNYEIDGRRSSSINDFTADAISILVNSAFLCRDLTICRGNLPKFLNEYIIMLTKTIENKFESLLQTNTKEELESKFPKGVIFEEELKSILHFVKKILNHADKKMKEDEASNETFVWFDLVKRINAKFQERAFHFASDRLQGNPKEIDEVKKKLAQKIVIDTTLVELDFIHKLCEEEHICIKSYVVSKAIQHLLEQLQNLPDAKTKEFIKTFYETLPDTSFYYSISDVTANEFQAILNDMAYAENIHTKNVLLAVQNTIDDRMNSIKHRTYNKTGRDVKLVHVILSDMDHFYSQHGVDPFHRFMMKFYDWTADDSRFSTPIRQVMKDIANTLSLESDEVTKKLINEVRVFLELTVDPEK